MTFCIIITLSQLLNGTDEDDLIRAIQEESSNGKTQYSQLISKQAISMSRRILRLAVARRAGDSTEEDESESESEESESEESDYGYDHTLTAAAIQIFTEEVKFNLGIEGSREAFVAALRRVQNDDNNRGVITKRQNSHNHKKTTKMFKYEQFKCLRNYVNL